MCGRYALGIRATFVRHQLQEHDMPVAEAPDDDDLRQTYNFAPGYHGLVYRADVPDYGGGPHHNDHASAGEAEGPSAPAPTEPVEETRYKLQAMKWGLVPFWTKRNPDYGNVLKTINCRDDSLAENRGMWTTMKQKKRCVVVAQGFYEWLKKNGGKEKIPHYVKRKDDQLMCFAGLWDCVQYEGSDEKHYTYTIITTDSNKQLKFLHDRMPVILENGTEQIRTWLDPKRFKWSKELQSLLKPYEGELECYPVSKDVGKVGNNSPQFIIPVASSENKNNIANFFSNGKAVASNKKGQNDENVKAESQEIESTHNTGPQESRVTVDEPRTEDNAPVPVPASAATSVGVKREREADEDEDKDEISSPATKLRKGRAKIAGKYSNPPKETDKTRKIRKTQSATSNGTATKGSPSKSRDGSQRTITNFFNK
ncbi:hypothetical protein MMC30_008851 [Trapelia coarctata]|nr:hypothetical protein [Trapelia coarctata]